MTTKQRNAKVDKLLAQALELLSEHDHPIRGVVDRYNQLYSEDYIAYDNNEHPDFQRVPDDLEVKKTSYNKGESRL